MCIAGHFEIKTAAEQQNTHSIKIDSEKKGTIINYSGKVKIFLPHRLHSFECEINKRE